MEILSGTEAVKKIHIYLSRDTLCPYFVISDGNTDFKKFFGDFDQIYISNFCADDFFLDVDLLVEKLNMLTNNALVFGLGEYIYFTGQNDILRSLQDKNFNRKVIFVCRGIANLLEQLAGEDFKFRTNHICRVEGKVNFSVVNYNPTINFPTDAKNFSELLKLMEENKSSATVQTKLPLKNIREINNFYDAIKNQEPNFSALPDALSDSQWQEYFPMITAKDILPNIGVALRRDSRIKFPIHICILFLIVPRILKLIVKIYFSPYLTWKTKKLLRNFIL